MAAELDKTHPGAAASLREGLTETLTVLRLGVAAHPGPHVALDQLHRVDDLGSAVSTPSNVKRWRDGQMALRWCAAGMVEAGKQFRRVNGHLHLPALRAALERRSPPRLSDPSVQNEDSERSLTFTGPPPKFHGTRDNLPWGMVLETCGSTSS